MSTTSGSKLRSSKLTRRQALGGMASISAPLVIPARLLSKEAPSNQITLGHIGMGLQGIGRNLKNFLSQKDQHTLAVCDVYRSAANRAKQIVDEHNGSKGCAVTQDFRELIAREDIDAIVISTPDHWHVPLAMAALKAGKDVFCEKPTLTISEGRELVNEVHKCKAVFQWGIEDRYLIKYYRLAGWVRAGLIGDLQSIEVSLPDKAPMPFENTAPVPEGLDWNLWLGPAPYHAYTPNRRKPQSWRTIFDYSGGVITDWGSHLIDTAQIGARMEDLGPTEVSGSGSLPDPEKFHSDVPMQFQLDYRYPNGVRMKVRNGGVDIRFVGSNGWVRCKDWNGTWSASDPEILRVAEFDDSADYWPRPPIEHRDFLNCVKSRGKPAYHAEAGHRLATALHLGHLAVRSGKTINWNPESESFADKSMQSNEIYRRSSRDWEAL